MQFRSGRSCVRARTCRALGEHNLAARWLVARDDLSNVIPLWRVYAVDREFRRRGDRPFSSIRGNFILILSRVNLDLKK